MKAKLLHVLASPHLGGAEQLCLWLAQGLVERGYDCNLLVLSRGKVSETAERMRIPTLIADLPDTGVVTRTTRRRMAADTLQETIGKLHPQIVHSHVPITNLICHRTLGRTSVPWIASIHGSWRQFGFSPQTLSKPWLRPSLMLRHAAGDYYVTRSASRVVAVSDYAARELARVGVPRRKIVTILNGIPATPGALSKEEGRNRLGLPQDALVIGAMGYFAPVKGFDLLIAAYAQVAPRYPKSVLIIAGAGVMGDTTMRSALEAQIRRHRIEGRVLLPGALSPHEGFLSALDLFVISSRTEGLPLALLEAMQHGKASVITSTSGCPEAARPELEGLVFESGSVSSLARQLERVLSDEALRESLGRSASARASTYLTLPRMVSEFEALYAGVVESSDHNF